MAKNEKEISKNKGHYFKDMKAELKKVVWPTRKQIANNTIAVIVFAIAIALIVFVLDLCFDAINKYGIKNLQEKITSSYSQSKESTESTDSTENNDNIEGNENEQNETNTSVEATTEGTTGSEANVENTETTTPTTTPEATTEANTESE